MYFKQLGLLLSLVLLFGLTACQTADKNGADAGGASASQSEEATASNTADTAMTAAEEAAASSAAERERSGMVGEGAIIFYSTPASRGNSISVLAGNKVTISVDAPGASSITVSGAPSGSTFDAAGSSAAFEWSTTEADVDGSPYRVEFSADNGGSIYADIDVMRSK